MGIIIHRRPIPCGKPREFSTIPHHAVRDPWRSPEAPPRPGARSMGGGVRGSAFRPGDPLVRGAIGVDFPRVTDQVANLTPIPPEGRIEGRVALECPSSAPTTGPSFSDPRNPVKHHTPDRPGNRRKSPRVFHIPPRTFFSPRIEFSILPVQFGAAIRKLRRPGPLHAPRSSSRRRTPAPGAQPIRN
jgi:hypothetical protein